MYKSLLVDLQEISSRLDSVITFTIIRYIYSVCMNHMSNIELIIISIIILIFLQLMDKIKFTDVGIIQLQLLLKKIVVLMMSQAVIASLGVNSISNYESGIPISILLQSLTSITCLLVFTSVIPSYFEDSALIQRCITLLLFIYADAIEALFDAIHLGIAPTLGCILLYICVHRYSHKRDKHSAIDYMIRALNMVSINFILRALQDLNVNASSLYIQTILLVIVLFILDIVSNLSDMFAETRNYAIWKTSQQIFQLYAAQNLDTVITLALSIVVFSTKVLWTSGLRTFFELVVLVVINVILDTATAYVSFTSSTDKTVLLFIYVIFIHHVTGLIF